MVARKGFQRYNKHINNAEHTMDVNSKFEVRAYKEQLEAAGLYDKDLWKTHKVYPHATAVVRSFYTMDAAEACYHTLRMHKGLGITKNWVY